MALNPFISHLFIIHLHNLYDYRISNIVSEEFILIKYAQTKTLCDPFNANVVKLLLFKSIDCDWISTFHKNY